MTFQTITSRLPADNIQQAEPSNVHPHPHSIQLAKVTLRTLQAYHKANLLAGWLCLDPILRPLKWRNMVNQQKEHERDQIKRIIRMLNNLP